MRNRVSLPLSALILAVVAALALGSAGTATAGGLTKATVKKIAAKVVTKKASSLSVAHAKTADSATTATTATTAGNASQLGGAAPSAYADRVAHELLTTDTAVPGAVQQFMNPTVITIPAGVGFIHVTAVANFYGGNTNVTIWPMLDATCAASGLGYNYRASSTTTQPTSIAINFLASVTPGDHAVRLCVQSGGATTASERSMTIETVAADFNG